MQLSDGRLWIAERHGQPIEQFHVSQGSSQDCGPHCVAVAVNFWLGQKKLEAKTVAREMNRPRLGMGLPPLVIRRIPNWATFPWGITDMLKAHGLHASWRVRASEKDLHRALLEDHIVMPIFGEPLQRQGWKWNGWSHVAILAGWDPAAETYWFIDSSHETTPSSRPRDTFLRHWNNMERLLIEAF